MSEPMDIPPVQREDDRKQMTEEEVRQYLLNLQKINLASQS